MTQLRYCLGQRTTADIKASIQEFNRKDIRNLDDKQLATEIKKVLMNPVDAQRSIMVLPASAANYAKGTRFSRVRRLSTPDLRRIHRDGIFEPTDCFEPPVDITSAVGPGRLNREEERILYTAYGGAGWATMACFEELEIQESDWFMIIEYEADRDFTAVTIGPERFAPPEREHELGEEELLKCRMLLDFVRSKFHQKIAAVDYHLYRVTRIIAREFSPGHTWSPGIWQYPSVAREGGWNVAFHPTQKNKLRVTDVKIANCRAYNRDFGARLIVIRYDTAGDRSRLNHRRLFEGEGPQAYFAITYPSRAERGLDEGATFIERADPEQNERLKNFDGRIVLGPETNCDGGTYFAARKAV